MPPCFVARPTPSVHLPRLSPNFLPTAGHKERQDRTATCRPSILSDVSWLPLTPPRPRQPVERAAGSVAYPAALRKRTLGSRTRACARSGRAMLADPRRGFQTTSELMRVTAMSWARHRRQRPGGHPPSARRSRGPHQDPPGDRRRVSPVQFLHRERRIARSSRCWPTTSWSGHSSCGSESSTRSEGPSGCASASCTVAGQITCHARRSPARLHAPAGAPGLRLTAPPVPPTIKYH
jgi:hypothetical protein